MEQKREEQSRKGGSQEKASLSVPQVLEGLRNWRHQVSGLEKEQVMKRLKEALRPTHCFFYPAHQIITFYPPQQEDGDLLSEEVNQSGSKLEDTVSN